MLFHSFGFFLFFCIVFATYWKLRSQRLRMAWLLAASCVFYGTWNPWLILLILFTAAVDYFVALRLMRERSPALRRALLALSICMSVGLLAFFKYARFLAENVITGLNLAGAHLDSPVWQIVLPLGISFYTFETISYVVDVYRGRIAAERNVINYALYIMFFPHLIAGPIVRPGFFLPQITRKKRFDWARLQLGAWIFLRGLFKKAVLADHLAAILDPVFAGPAGYSGATMWWVAPCYAIQLYCDFSGYSDMAIGTAHAFGFKLPLNFNLPYFAASVREFWRRWHITLSTWLRDYVYIPLGGSRLGPARNYFNLIITMTLCGLWHGAGWTYVLFGFFHAMALCLERALPAPPWLSLRILQPVRVAITFMVVALGFVIFRSESLGHLGIMLSRAISGATGVGLGARELVIGTTILAVAFVGHLAGTFFNPSRWRRRLSPVTLGIGLACWFLLIQLLMPQDGAPFIYFQF